MKKQKKKEIETYIVQEPKPYKEGENKLSPPVFIKISDLKPGI